MNNFLKTKKARLMGEKYFYNKNNYHKAIIHFKRTINNKNKYFANDEEILRKISKSYLYLSDNYDNNREYYLSKAMLYIDESLRVSSWYLKAIELKLEILQEIWNNIEIIKTKKIIQDILLKVKNQEVDLDKFYWEIS